VLWRVLVLVLVPPVTQLPTFGLLLVMLLQSHHLQLLGGCHWRLRRLRPPQLSASWA
jgi:hypothetical protein